MLFSDLGPHYTLRYLEGLENQTRNHKPFDWSPVLTMLAKVIALASASQPDRIATDRENPGWSWVLLAAASLIAVWALQRRGAISQKRTCQGRRTDRNALGRARVGAGRSGVAPAAGCLFRRASDIAWHCAGSGDPVRLAARRSKGEAKPERALPPLTVEQFSMPRWRWTRRTTRASAPLSATGSTRSCSSIPSGWSRTRVSLWAKRGPARKAAFWDGYLSRGRITLEAYPYMEPFLRDEVGKVGSEGYNETAAASR